MKYQGIICGALLAGGQLLAQGTTRVDTVYTPEGYGNEDGPLTASIFIPDPSSARGIGVVLAHSRGETRLLAKVWCDTLAARGYVAMTIDYYDVGGGLGRYPAPVRAEKTAVEFLKKNWERFGITTQQIVAFGQGGGAFAWGQAIVNENDDVFFNTDNTIDDHVAAAVLLYGAYDNDNNMSPDLLSLTTTYFSAYPALRSTSGNCIANIDKITMPVLLIHGINDASIPVVQARALHDSIISHGGKCELKEHMGGHGFDLTTIGPTTSFTPAGRAAKDEVLAFLEQNVLTSAGESPRQHETPDGFALLQNYPNPFNPQTTIRYALPKASHVRLEVVNLLGESVAVLVDKEHEQGFYSVQFDGSNLSSGTYFTRMRAGSYISTKKMVLVR